MQRNRRGDDRGNQRQGSNKKGVAHYQHEDEEDGDLQGFGYNQNAEDDEVSLDIHDAIATAEELNSSQQRRHGHAAQ